MTDMTTKPMNSTCIPVIYLSIHPTARPPTNPSTYLCRFLSFLIHTVSRISRTGDQPVTRPLPTYRTTQTQNKRPQTSMSRVEFEPTIPVFQRAKTVHGLDRAATLIGRYHLWANIMLGLII
jgi:hypothetical protein